MEGIDPMTIIQQLEVQLADERFRRIDPADVRRVMDRLAQPKSPVLLALFERFRGPIGSRVTGFQLLDATEETPCVVSATEFIRTKYGLGRNWVVLSDLVGDGVMMYDTATNRVFDVDFEGGIELLRAGELEPTHASLEAFLSWFFELKSP